MTASELDRLADDLARETRHAAGARADAQLVAAFHQMTQDVEAAAIEIEQTRTALRGPSPLAVADSYPGDLQERAGWVAAQITKVRETLNEDPMRVRQGTLWRETQRAVTTLRTELREILDTAYANLLAGYSVDDRHLLDTLPPGIRGVRDYRIAIEQFERFRAARPSTSDDVRAAAASGRRLRELRERVEAEAVPAEFQDQWRQVRTTGLPLSQLTDSFVAWLRERGLASATLLSYRAS
jgi:hypothetical protein